jgi:hypothetical protein
MNATRELKHYSSELNNDKVTHEFIGLVLQKRFILVEEFESSGQFGRNFIANDILNNNKEVFVKISPDLAMNNKEFHILQNLQRQDKTNFAKLLSGGEFVMQLPTDTSKIKDDDVYLCSIKNQRHSFIVMEKYGSTL